MTGCLDLDGSTGFGEILSVSIGFGAGKQVLIKLDLSGNQRGGNSDNFFFEATFAAALPRNTNIIM